MLKLLHHHLNLPAKSFRYKTTFMVPYSLNLQAFHFVDKVIKLEIPDFKELKTYYELSLQPDKEPIPFPFWGKIWPAALALSTFLERNRTLIENKRVLEIGAGLGLPGLLAAHFSKEVIISDYLLEPVELIANSIKLNAFRNASARMLDWSQLPDDLDTDVLLLSDVNYDPVQFEALLNMLHGFLGKGCSIILSSPQRIMASSFVRDLMPYIISSEEFISEDHSTPCSVLVLKG